MGIRQGRGEDGEGEGLLGGSCYVQRPAPVCQTLCCRLRGSALDPPPRVSHHPWRVQGSLATLLLLPPPHLAAVRRADVEQDGVASHHLLAEQPCKHNEGEECGLGDQAFGLRTSGAASSRARALLLSRPPTGMPGGIRAPSSRAQGGCSRRQRRATCPGLRLLEETALQRLQLQQHAAVPGRHQAPDGRGPAARLRSLWGSRPRGGVCDQAGPQAHPGPAWISIATCQPGPTLCAGLGEPRASAVIICGAAKVSSDGFGFQAAPASAAKREGLPLLTALSTKARTCIAASKSE